MRALRVYAYVMSLTRKAVRAAFLHPQRAHSSQLEFGNDLLKKRYFEMLLPVSQISTCVVQETLAWFTPNIRKDLSCIQSREKIGARREEVFSS